MPDMTTDVMEWLKNEGFERGEQLGKCNWVRAGLVPDSEEFMLWLEIMSKHAFYVRRSGAQSVPAKQYRRTMKWQGMKERIYFDNGGSKFKIEDSIEYSCRKDGRRHKLTTTTTKGGDTIYACEASVIFYNCNLISPDQKELTESTFVVVHLEHSHETQQKECFFCSKKKPAIGRSGQNQLASSMVRKFIKKTKDEGVRDLTTLRNLTVEFSKEYCVVNNLPIDPDNRCLFPIDMDYNNVQDDFNIQTLSKPAVDERTKKRKAPPKSVKRKVMKLPDSGSDLEDFVLS